MHILYNLQNAQSVRMENANSQLVCESAAGGREGGVLLVVLPGLQALHHAAMGHALAHAWWLFFLIDSVCQEYEQLDLIFVEITWVQVVGARPLLYGWPSLPQFLCTLVSSKGGWMCWCE